MFRRIILAITATIALVFGAALVGPPATATESVAGAPYPTAETTGVSPGVVLTPGSNDVCGVVTRKKITGDLNLTCDADVRNSRITGRIVTNGFKFTGTHVDIGPDSCSANPSTDRHLILGVFDLNFAHLHNNGGQDPLGFVEGTSEMTNSLIDQTCFYNGDHLDGVQLYAPGDKVVATFRHNTIDVRPANSSDKGNAAVFLADNPGRGTSITLADNYLAGGQYTLAAYDAYRGSGVSYIVKNNVFEVNSYALAPCATNSPSYNGTDGLSFTGNTYSNGSAMSAC